jgi:hypothetical protein
MPWWRQGWTDNPFGRQAESFLPLSTFIRENEYEPFDKQNIGEVAHIIRWMGKYKVSIDQTV